MIVERKELTKNRNVHLKNKRKLSSPAAKAHARYFRKKVLPGLPWVQAVWKGYQRTTLVTDD